MSKTFEQCVSSQLIHYITSNSIVDFFQIAYIPHRSSETALHLIISDILLSLDSKSPYYLVLLDLSCVFDFLNLQIRFVYVRLVITVKVNNKLLTGSIHLYLKDIRP